MLKESREFAHAALAAALLGLAACSAQKEPAEQALAAIEKTFSASGAEIQKYLPERHAEIAASIESLRTAMANEDYGDVVAGANSVRDQLKRAVADSRIARAQMLVAMEDEWVELTKTMPAMIEAMGRKISAQRGRPPEGMAKDDWKATIETYDAARDAWSKAADEISTANFEASVLAARDAKAKITGIMESIDMKAS